MKVIIVVVHDLTELLEKLLC